jgi:hypothetical protein
MPGRASRQGFARAHPIAGGKPGRVLAHAMALATARSEHRGRTDSLTAVAWSP